MIRDRLIEVPVLGSHYADLGCSDNRLAKRVASGDTTWIHCV